MAVLRPSVENIRSLGNFSQTFRWLVDFKSFPKGLPGGYTTEDINFRAESVSLPEKEIELTEIQIRGNKVRQEGIGTYNSPITLTLIETVNPVCLSFLNDWQELAWKSSNGSIGTTQYKNMLECEMYLTLLDSQDKPYYKYTLIGCQIGGGTGGDLDAQSADPLKPALSIAFDYFTRQAIRRQTMGAPGNL